MHYKKLVIYIFLVFNMLKDVIFHNLFIYTTLFHLNILILFFYDAICLSNFL